MMVMMMAITPSLKASSRFLPMSGSVVASGEKGCALPVCRLVGQADHGVVLAIGLGHLQGGFGIVKQRQPLAQIIQRHAVALMGASWLLDSGLLTLSSNCPPLICARTRISPP
jgi:hypothetical protein